jgi:hypothetical protein
MLNYAQIYRSYQGLSAAIREKAERKQIAVVKLG